MLYWYWLILGLVLIVLEIVVPSFVVIWFGIAALLTGLIAVWVTGLAAQLGLFAVLSTLSFSIGWFGFIKKARMRSHAGLSKEAVLGEVGVVATVRNDPFTTGRVRFQIAVLGDESWDFVCDEPLATGDRVAIVDVLGSKLKVRKA